MVMMTGMITVSPGHGEATKPSVERLKIDQIDTSHCLVGNLHPLSHFERLVP